MKQSKHTAFGKYIRTLCALLLVITLMPLALSATAQEVKPTNLFGSSLLDQEGWIMDMVQVGDTLYIMTSVGLYTYKPGDSKANLLTELITPQSTMGLPSEENGPMIANLYSDGQNLLGLDTVAQKLYTLTFDQDQVQFDEGIKLDLSDFVQGEPPFVSVAAPQWSKVIGGRLYMKMQNYEGLAHDLFSFDIKTGEKKVHDTVHLQTAAEYKDGKIIGVQQNPQNRYNMETGTPIAPPLVIYDPMNETVTPMETSLTTNEITGDTYPIYYDAREDSLYTYTDTDVIRLDGDMKTSRLIGYLPMFGSYSAGNGSIQPLSDGRLAIAAGQNVFLRERTEKGLEGFTVLSMSGSMDDPTIMTRVLMEMDNVVIRRVEGVPYNQINAEQLASMFLTGNVPADIMLINVNGFDLDKLIEKGYLADLSSNADIASYLSTFAPNMGKAFTRDGKLYGVPTSLLLFPMHANIKAFEEIGREIPTNLNDLVTLAEEWMLGLNEDYPHYNLFSDGGNYKRTLTDQVIEKYIANKLGAGEELVFDTPVFRSLMERIAKIDFGDNATDPNWEDPVIMTETDEFWNRTSLLETGMGYEPRYATGRNRGNDNPQQPLVLSIEEGQPSFMEADLNLLVVMSSSKNIDIATQFLGKFVGKLNPVDKAAFNLDAKEAIPNPNFDREMESLDKTKKMLQDSYDKAEGAEKSNLEESLKYFNEYYELMKAEGMFLATAKDLENIHLLTSHLYINTGLGNAQKHIFSDSYELIVQYNDGAISLDQFVRQLDDKLRLVRMEYQ